VARSTTSTSWRTRRSKVDVGFVQGGLAEGRELPHLVSLGSVYPQPMMVYCRHPEPVELLSQLKGKRIAVGPEGSGARVLAQKLLKINDMDGPPTVLLDLAGDEAAKQLLAGTIDAAFLMGDSATPSVMKTLRGVPEIQLASFRQADGYLRKFRFLSKETLPEGAMDIAKNYPPRTLTLIGPTVELVARDDLHPALSDLLIRAAREVHGSPGMFRNAGEYPAPLARDFPISPDAERYYKSGEQFLYKRLPFWLASLVDRLLVVVLPLLVIIVPATRLAPAIYRWRIRSRIYRWYGALMAIEREMRRAQTARAEGEGARAPRRDRARGQRAAHAAVIRRPALRPARPRRRRPPPPRRRRRELTASLSRNRVRVVEGPAVAGPAQDRRRDRVGAALERGAGLAAQRELIGADDAGRPDEDVARGRGGVELAGVRGDLLPQLG
jgi:hypothetical protein